MLIYSTQGALRKEPTIYVLTRWLTKSWGVSADNVRVTLVISASKPFPPLAANADTGAATVASGAAVIVAARMTRPIDFHILISFPL